MPRVATTKSMSKRFGAPGVGNLFEAFLQLKQKLATEGCFDAARKQALPGFVRQIGIITSPQAAALRDIVSTLRRRAPHVSLIVYPTLVQGSEAVPQLVKALQTANARAECQLLLLCRGGGSIEDLWAFNEEAVARAILACTIPVISGIGHETDFTIADFCADLRAPTPTAAAELAAVPTTEWQAKLAELGRRSALAMRRNLEQTSLRLDYLSRRLPPPQHLISREKMRLTNLATRLEHARSAPLSRARQLLTQWQMRLAAQRPGRGPPCRSSCTPTTTTATPLCPATATAAASAAPFGGPARITQSATHSGARLCHGAR